MPHFFGRNFCIFPHRALVNGVGLFRMSILLRDIIQEGYVPVVDKSNSVLQSPVDVGKSNSLLQSPVCVPVVDKSSSVLQSPVDVRKSNSVLWLSLWCVGKSSSVQSSSLSSLKSKLKTYLFSCA